MCLFIVGPCSLSVCLRRENERESARVQNEGRKRTRKEERSEEKLKWKEKEGLKKKGRKIKKDSTEGNR